MTKRKSEEKKSQAAKADSMPKESVKETVEPKNGHEKMESTQTDAKQSVPKGEVALQGYATQFTHTDSVVGMIPKSYTVGTLVDLVKHIEKNVSEYCNSGVTAVVADVGTPYANMSTYAALDAYTKKDDSVKAGSKIQLRTNDGTLACTVYVGDKYQFLANAHEMNEDDALWETFKRDSGRALKDLGVFVGGQIIGHTVGRAFRFTGALLRTGSFLYAAGDAASAVVEGFKQSASCTVYFKPLTEVSSEQAAKYRELVDKYKGK